MAPDQTPIRDRLRDLATRASAVTLPIVATPLFAGSVAAQSAADEAGSAMCQTGLGGLITFVLGGIAIVLILVGAFRGAVAWNNMGSARSDKKQQGKEQLKGAGITTVGAFFPAIFAVGLDQAGISTLSCVDFTNIIYLAPYLPA